MQHQLVRTRKFNILILSMFLATCGEPADQRATTSDTDRVVDRVKRWINGSCR